MSEEQIIQEILAGDTSKFREIVVKYQQQVFRIVMGFVHSKEDAEDLSQDIFIKSYQSLASFNGDSAFSTWLYRIAVNTTLNHITKMRRWDFIDKADEILQKLVNRSSGEKTPLKLMEESERNRLIRKSIDSLPGKQRKAFVLSKYEELSQKEIADIMQVTEGAVEQLLQRAKTNLQKKLASLVGNE